MTDRKRSASPPGESHAENVTLWVARLSSCNSEEQQTLHLDTGHIERIYLGVSRSVCSLSWALERSSPDEMRSVLTGQREAFESGRQADKHVKSGIELRNAARNKQRITEHEV